MAGLAYVVVSIALALLLGRAAREGPRSGDSDTDYRYPLVIVRAVAACIPLIAVLTALTCSTYPTGRPRGLEWAPIVGFVGPWMLLNVYGYFYARSFRVELSQEAVTVTYLRTRKRVAFDSVRSMHIYRGANGGAQMMLLGERNRKLLSIGSGVRDFDSLLWLVSEAMRQRGVGIRERNKWGRWSSPS